MQKIKLTIANRVYPLNVPLEQEEGLRTASKKIELMNGNLKCSFREFQIYEGSKKQKSN